MRIVSLSPATTEIVCALGLEGSLVAVTHLCDYPQSVQLKPKIGTWISSNINQLESLKPNIVLTSYYLPPQLLYWKHKQLIFHTIPKTLAEVLQSILDIGKKLGRTKQAQQVVNQMKKEFGEIKQKQPRYKPRVYLEEWHTPPFASGNWVPDLVNIAGGKAFSKNKESSYEVFLDQVVEFDPEIIIVHWCGAGTKQNLNLVYNRPGWNKLRAVANKKVFPIDDSLLNRPGPRLVLGTHLLSNIFNKQKTGN